MDSFEARLQFIQVLKNLQKTLNVLKTGGHDESRSNSPSLNRSTGTDPIQFYLKNYYQHYEDFHQCLFDTASKMDPLDRINVVLYYARIMCILKSRDSDVNSRILKDHLLPSLDKLLLLALPVNEWNALTNLKSCIEVFQWLNEVWGNVMSWTDEIPQVDLSIPISQLTWYECPADTADPEQSFKNTVLLLKDRLAKQQYLFEYYKTNGICDLATSSSSSTILHRMENDREKHKRLKENNWVLERPSISIVDPQEFRSMWENEPYNTLTKQDYKNIKDLNRIAQQSYATGYN